MIFRMSRFTLWGLSISCLLLLSACVNHVVTGKTSPQGKKIAEKLSKTQIRLLAQEILRNTPEYIHFSNSSHFSWVVLTPEVQANPQALQGEVLNLLSEKYKVYVDTKELPEDLIEKNSKGMMIGYKKGFSFSYTLTFEENGIIKIHYHDYEGNLASSGHFKRYKWNGKNWEIIEKSALIVS